MDREQKQITFSVEAELEQALMDAKKRFFSDASESVMLHELILLGLENIRGEKMGDSEWPASSEKPHSQENYGGKQ